MRLYIIETHYCVFQGGLSALMLCCEEGNLEMAKLLLVSHANPDLQQSVSTGHSLCVSSLYLASTGRFAWVVL